MAIKRSALALVALVGTLFCVAGSTVPTAVTETESPTEAPGECEQYCSGSYPKHTYPEVNVHIMVFLALVQVLLYASHRLWREPA